MPLERVERDGVPARRADLVHVEADDGARAWAPVRGGDVLVVRRRPELEDFADAEEARDARGTFECAEEDGDAAVVAQVRDGLDA